MYCTSFCRLRLGETMKAVRAVVSQDEIKKAWVWKSPGYNGNDVEFHGPNDFHWSDNGCCLWSARSDGWDAYLRHLEYKAQEAAQAILPTVTGLIIGQEDRKWFP